MAPSKKRKRENECDDDDDTTYGLRQILPVANLPIDFDGEPQDGLQYLFLVRRDARKLPGVKHVANPYAFIPPQPTQPICRAKAAPLLPCKEWRSKFACHFHNFRGNMSQPVVRPRQPGPVQRTVPEKKNRDAWWSFLEGAPESVWNPPKTAGRGKERVGQCGIAAQQICDTSSSDTALWKPRELSPTLLFQVDHRFTLHLIMYFTHWFNMYLESLDSNSNSTTSQAPTDVHMRWLFALLTRVELFCSADEIVSLRNLARTCLALISAVRHAKTGSTPPSAPCEREDGETETGSGTTTEAEANVNPSSSARDPKTLSECSMWVVFCAVTNVWGQQDLWDEAEQALGQPLRQGKALRA
ncbi:hypothetical protein BJY52DRAFT_35757 [Lactarius psammicola]|nr:hypothetical protein BJY52DRAFT_35757 [Lactarius psammicola]